MVAGSDRGFHMQAGFCRKKLHAQLQRHAGQERLGRRLQAVFHSSVHCSGVVAAQQLVHLCTRCRCRTSKTSTGSHKSSLWLGTAQVCVCVCACPSSQSQRVMGVSPHQFQSKPTSAPHECVHHHARPRCPSQPRAAVSRHSSSILIPNSRSCVVHYLARWFRLGGSDSVAPTERC